MCQAEVSRDTAARLSAKPALERDNGQLARPAACCPVSGYLYCAGHMHSFRQENQLLVRGGGTVASLSPGNFALNSRKEDGKEQCLWEEDPRRERAEGEC